MKPAAIFTPMLDLVFPPRCPLCGDPNAEGDGLCLGCWAELPLVTDPCCPLCALPVDEQAAGQPCPECLAHPPPQCGLTAASYYGSAARDLAIRFKQRGQPGTARMMGALLSSRLAEIGNGWLVIPVPLHRWRIWHRGFNQAALLAQAVAARHGLPLLVDALARYRATQRLEGLSRAERARVMANVIRPNPRIVHRLEGADVLLVDDVVTTGATTAACIAALRQAGVVRVHIACWARVPLGH